MTTTPHAELLTDDELDTLDEFSLHWGAPRQRDSVRAYGRAIERALLARLGEQQPEEPDPADEWRNLALQFDRHRISALWHLKAMLQDPAAHADKAREFLAAPPPAAQPVAQGEREALQGLYQALRDRHYGRMPDEVQAAYDKAAEVLAARSAAQGAAQVPISVDERLPPKNTEVFVCFAGQNTLWSTGQYTGSTTDVNGWCYPAENRGMTDDGSDPVVTHWLPMFDVPGITPTTKEQQA